MIAANYRKHPEAIALQMPLPFPHRLVWATARPGMRILRTIRAARAAAFKAAGRIRYPETPTVPAWWKEAKKRARNLAATVRDACAVLWAEVRVAITTADTELIGFNYEDQLRQALTRAENSGNRYRANLLRRRLKEQHRFYAQGCPRCEKKWVRIIPAPVGLGQWPECVNCGAAWSPDLDHDKARRELAGEDDND